MRKLNRIHSVLSDPDRRRHYDEVLLGGHLPPTIVLSPSGAINLRRLMARFAWIGAVLVSVAFLVWLASEGAAGPQVQSFEHAATTPNVTTISIPVSGSPGEEIAQLQSDLRIATAERDAAIRELTRLRSASSGPRISMGARRQTQTAPAPTLMAATTELPLPPRPAPSVPSVQLPRPPAVRSAPAPARQFTGFWFYTRPVQGQLNKNRALYPPEFIEAILTEQNGLVHGKYRSRYQIVDRAISPDVNFEFSGTPNGCTMICPWSGPGGSRGELTVRITGENSMRIDWTASQLGNVQELASGTAMLNRRVE